MQLIGGREPPNELPNRAGQPLSDLAFQIWRGVVRQRSCRSNLAATDKALHGLDAGNTGQLRENIPGVISNPSPGWPKRFHIHQDAHYFTNPKSKNANANTRAGNPAGNRANDVSNNL
jgi:hypothetical protein